LLYYFNLKNAAGINLVRNAILLLGTRTRTHAYPCKKGDAEARFLIEPDIELTANKGFKPHELAIAEEVIKDNREYMIEHWKLFFKTTKMQ
jgi:hypothetical protein